MKFTPLYANGPVVITPQKLNDDRGFFARTFCEKEFDEFGLPIVWPQMNVSFNKKQGTVRGMHFQVPPFEEPKIVRVTSGSIMDAVIDLRYHSPDFGRVDLINLSVQDQKALYIPPGFAHGFQTLEDNTEVFYLMGASFEPAAQTGVRWNDPAFNVTWPLNVSVISDKDMSYSDFNREHYEKNHHNGC